MDGVGIDHHFHQLQHQHLNHGRIPMQQYLSGPPPPRKRKAETAPEHNERLSKRMSLLNLEQSGQKLYVPVENNLDSQSTLAPSLTTTNPQKPHKHHHHHRTTSNEDDSQMQLDDSKHKVYIYNLDDELSSSDNESGDDAKLVFLPDIEKHLRNSRRIPTHVLNPRPDAASEGKELVLYRVPSSLSVPEEQDSVRKAIIEARERARERQRVEREQSRGDASDEVSVPAVLGDVSMDAEPLPGLVSVGEEDPDAMELD